jgi:hypothetical protein
MFKERWILPTKRQIEYLRRIDNGHLTWYVKDSEIAQLYGETHENGDPKALALMLAEEHVKELKNSRAFDEGLLDIRRVEEVAPGEWCVAVFATDHLLRIKAVLERGVYWNRNMDGPDFERTEKEWQGYLTRGSVTDSVFEAASNNHDPELRKVRAALVMFKLTASRYGDTWRTTYAA